VGLVEETAFPPEVTATQSAAEGQETLRRLPPTAVTVQAPGPAVGTVEVRTLPPLSTAAHSDADGQATRVRPPSGPSTAAPAQARAPPPGSLEA
jgi:hypothetical protein